MDGGKRRAPRPAAAGREPDKRVAFHGGYPHMIRRTLIARLFAAAALTVAVAGTAGAGIIPASVTVTPDGGNFRWTYAVVLPTDMKLEAGNFFTIYDVHGLVSGTIQAPPNWTATVAMNVASAVSIATAIRMNSRSPLVIPAPPSYKSSPVIFI